MKIDVNWKHIIYGSQGDPNNCGIAQALKEAGHKHVSVNLSGAVIDGKRYKHNASKFVSNFDKGKKFSGPATVEFTLVAS